MCSIINGAPELLVVYISLKCVYICVHIILVYICEHNFPTSVQPAEVAALQLDPLLLIPSYNTSYTSPPYTLLYYLVPSYTPILPLAIPSYTPPYVLVSYTHPSFTLHLYSPLYPILNLAIPRLVSCTHPRYTLLAIPLLVPCTPPSYV